MDFLSGSYPLGKDISCSQMLTSVWEKTTGTKRCYSMVGGGGVGESTQKGHKQNQSPFSSIINYRFTHHDFPKTS